jgi:hypothetical protein
MSKARKTAREKLHNPQEAKVVDEPDGRGRMLIPRPLDVDALVRRIQKGKLLTVDQVRDQLAKEANADFTCPLTAGIFIRITAEAAEEDLRDGETEITPYWRVLKKDGSLNDKFPGGVDAQASRLSREGHSVEPGRGNKAPKVKDFEESLQSL